MIVPKVQAESDYGWKMLVLKYRRVSGKSPGSERG